MLEQYTYKANKKLRYGYTTGSCAAAAARAATRMLLSGKRVEEILLMTPKGIRLCLKIEEISMEKNWVRCAVRKDAGDDADITDGILICADVEKEECPKRKKCDIIIDGGVGVGRVTKRGLTQKIGEAAINPIPRKMIYENVYQEAEDFCYTGCLNVVISVPEGIEIAKKTFNPRLGIEGGISILGTSGIVEPMSEVALIDTIHAEIQMKAAQGERDLILTPGNYGSDFIKQSLHIDLEHCIKCSNFIGDTIDMAYEFQLRSFLLIGHIGKLVKLGAGIMNTHSRYADARMEILCSCFLMAGGTAEQAREILNCTTTEEAIDQIEYYGKKEQTMEQLMKKIEFHLKRRAFDGLEIGAIVFSNQHGILGKTTDADRLKKRFLEGEQEDGSK